MLIYVDKTSKYEYDVVTLLEKAKYNSTTEKTAYNGKCISVGYLDKDNYYQYQVLKLYK